MCAKKNNKKWGNTHQGKTEGIKYLSCIMINTKAEINPLWSPEAFDPEIILKFF